MSNRAKTSAEQTSIRLHADLLTRAEALLPKLRERSALRIPALKRSDVLRLAIEAGLNQLEQEYK